jgi:DNA-binding MarR family transcriptional regulator
MRAAPAASDAPQALAAILRAADRVTAAISSTLAPHGITGQQYNVLRILRGAEPNGLPTLAVASRCIERAPGITRMVDRLEAKRLVLRERCEEDRRCVFCRITAEGLGLLARLDPPVAEASRAAFAGLTEQDLTSLAQLLQRVGKTSNRGLPTGGSLGRRPPPIPLP